MVAIDISTTIAIPVARAGYSPSLRMTEAAERPLQKDPLKQASGPQPAVGQTRPADLLDRLVLASPESSRTSNYSTTSMDYQVRASAIFFLISMLGYFLGENQSC